MGLLEELAALREAQPNFAFLDYDGLLAAVESRDPDAALRRMRGELDKVNDVATVQSEVLCTEFKKQLRKDVVDNFETLENLAKAIVQLHSYVSLAYEALMSIVHKCGEQEETASCVWFASRVECAPFRACNFDKLLAELGQLYAAWRRRRGQAGAPRLDAKGDGPTQAFFIPKGSVMLTKVALLKLLEPAVQKVRIPTTSTTRCTGSYSYDMGRKLSQVFFDGPHGDQYAERYRRNLPAMEGSSSERKATKLLQCSWVREAERDTEVRLTLEDPDGATVEAQLPHREMPALLATTLNPAAVASKGGGSPEECKQQEAALQSALKTIKEGGLRPSVSASFLRYSYVADGSTGSAEVASVDEDLIFRDEAAAATREWCLAAGAKRAEEEFPGAVLQLRLPASAAEKLLTSLGKLDLKPIPGFSAALHGTALFHRQLAVPPPPWIPSESLSATAASAFLLPDFKRPSGLLVEEAAGAASPVKVKATPKEAAKKPAAAAAEGARRGWWSPLRCLPQTSKPDKKLFVDVKTPMASERTVIRWFRSAVLMVSLSGILMAGKDLSANINGFLLGIAALLFIALPTLQFRQRSIEFMSPEASQPKVNRTLPTVLAWVLAVILSATLVVQVNA